MELPQSSDSPADFSVVVEILLDHSVVGWIKLRPGWLGVEIEDLDPQRAAQLQLGGTLGAYVEGTRNRSPARKAGILEGDLITGFDGATVRTSSDLLNYAQGLVAGQTVALDVLRNGTRRTIYVAIEARR